MRPATARTGRGEAAGSTVLVQHRLFHRTQFGRWLDPELLNEVRPQPVIRPQCVALSAGLDERLHEELDRTLAQRSSDHEHLQPDDGVGATAELQQRLGVQLMGQQLQLAEPGQVGGNGGVVELGVRVAANQRDRLTKLLESPGNIRFLLRPVDRGAEPMAVDQIEIVDDQAVSALLREDLKRRRQRTPQSRDDGVQRTGWVLGQRLTSPHELDDLAGVDHRSDSPHECEQ